MLTQTRFFAVRNGCDKSLLDETLNRTGIIRKLLDYYIYYVNKVT